jgi:hypothetical protein
VVHDESASTQLAALGDQLNHFDRINHVKRLHENDRDGYTMISENASMRTERVMVLVLGS